jgi:hypothetical protein
VRTGAWFVVVAAGLLVYAVMMPVFAQEETGEQAQAIPSGTPTVVSGPSLQPSPRASSGATPIPAPPCTIVTEWPPDFAVVGPAEGLDPTLARFSGVWEGTWDGFPGPYPVRLGIERIDAGRATAVYGYPSVRDLTAGWIRFSPVVFGETITWGPSPATVKFSFTISRDGRTISGRLEQPPLEEAVITMSRCTLG